MQKAHLYEALYLVNHGIDEAVRGVQRLKKAPHAFREVYYKSVAGLERRRALINGQFMHEMSGEEEDNASFFEEEFNRWLSDDPLDSEESYKLVHFLDDQRKKKGGKLSAKTRGQFGGSSSSASTEQTTSHYNRSRRVPLDSALL